MDEGVFRFINGVLRDPWLDRLMPHFSDKDYVVIPGAVIALVAMYLGRRRTRVCLAALLIAVAVSDLSSERLWKNLFQRERPFVVLDGVNVFRSGEWTALPSAERNGTRESYAFPSTHAANIAAVAAALAFLRGYTLVITVPAALLVGWSRVYLGQHYPSDVLFGWAWGAGCGAAATRISLRIGERCWRGAPEPIRAPFTRDRKCFLGLLTAWATFHFAYAHFSGFGLSGDEALYWEYSRRLDWGYYSKPPLIAYVIAILTAAGGNSEWAIRSGAVLLSSGTMALIHSLALRVTRDERAALLAAVVYAAMPLAWIGAAIMTPDPLLCFFWALALYAFHRAVNGAPRVWWVVGISLGLGLMAKYTAALLLAAMAAYLIAVERRLLRTRGPWLALAVALAVNSGVVVWNASHDWASLRHTVAIGARDDASLLRAMEGLARLAGGQLGAASPILFLFLTHSVAVCCARAWRQKSAAMLALPAAAVAVFYLLVSFGRSPEANWPAAAYVSAIPAWAWVRGGRPRARRADRLLVAGIALGVVLSVAARSTGVLYQVGSRYDEGSPATDRVRVGPVEVDPDWDASNALAGGRELGTELSKWLDGPPDEQPFIFSDRYQLAALAAFYTKGHPRVYCASPAGRRMNQYDIWGGWDELKGRDALFVTGGGRFRAQLFVNDMIRQGWFQNGDVLRETPVYRGKIRVKTFTVSRLFNYSGKPWNNAHSRH